MAFTDDLATEAKSKWPSLLIAGVLALVGLLAAVVWRDALSGLAKLIWSATPKDTLGALLGISVLALGALALTALHYRRKLKESLAAKPTGTNDPVDQPPADEREDYEPDELAVKVLNHIARADFADPVGVLPEELKLDPLLIRHRVDKLLQYHFIRYEALALLRQNSPYSLTPKGTEYLVGLMPQPDSRTKELNKAAERLHTIIDHLPSGDVKEKYVDIYHQALREIENDTGVRLIQFSIPPDELKYNETYDPGTPNVGSRRGRPASTIRSKDRYCDRSVFLIALKGAITSLKR